jgi:hypothetical protein
MYDEEHHNMIVAGNRGTLWELHPITNIQVSTTTGWVALDKLNPAKPSTRAGLMAMGSGAPDVELANARSPEAAAKFLQQEARLAELERKSE